MYTRTRMKLRMMRILLGCALLAPWAAHAGVPAPGLVLYGQVTDAGGSLLTAGELVWTFTPSGGGPAITVATRLNEIDAPGGPFSYRALLPLETEAQGFPATGSALPVGAVSAEYMQDGQVVDTEIQTSTIVSFSSADISSVKRVDICIDCEAASPALHSADIDGNLRFSLSELLRGIELHTATPTHEYHAAAATEDGFAPGNGARGSAPHTGDYYGGADWHMTVHELVRLIDLFTSTPDHAYTPEPASEDGFTKAAQGKTAGNGPAFAVDGTIAPATMRRLVQGGAVGAVNTLRVNVEVTSFGGDPLSAMGVVQDLPAGWRYAGLVDGGAVAAAPRNGATDRLEFTWFPVPSLPYTFSYDVLLPQSSSVEYDYYAFQGEGLYRTVSGKDQTTIAFGVEPESGLLDTDGDGIADLQEAGADSDGDQIPDFLDVDSDNDGLSDLEEANYDGDPNYDPYDPDTNPGGTDLDATAADTDGDGLNDSDEVSANEDPLDASTIGMPVPASNIWTLLALIASLAACMTMALRTRYGKARQR